MKHQSILLGMTMAVLLAPAQAAAEPWAVFGLELGQPVTLPECQRMVLPNGNLSSYMYETDPDETCHEPDIELRDAPWRRGAITFPLQQRPLILSFNSGFTHIVDGRLEGLQFQTLGYANASAIIDELSAKFGEPSWIGETTSKVSGLAVPAIVAEWDLPDLYVRYTSIWQDIDDGELLIETPVMRAVRAAHEEQQARPAYSAVGRSAIRNFCSPVCLPCLLAARLLAGQPCH